MALRNFANPVWSADGRIKLGCQKTLPVGEHCVRATWGAYRMLFIRSGKAFKLSAVKYAVSGGTATWFIGSWKNISILFLYWVSLSNSWRNTDSMLRCCGFRVRMRDWSLYRGRSLISFPRAVGGRPHQRVWCTLILLSLPGRTVIK